VTVYLRRCRFGGMTRRDWKIFLLSWLIANAWWSVVCFTGLSAVQWLWAWWMGFDCRMTGNSLLSRQWGLADTQNRFRIDHHLQMPLKG
jgi:hypothetical protein